MPGYPAPFIKFREVDANGKPLAGGKLWSYTAGTSTPRPTFTSADLLTENENPVILDASGRASVWIDDGIGYKFVLTDALDNEIWTEDLVQVPQVAPAPVTPIMPPGTIVAFGGSAAPAGWLLCDGAAVSTTTYTDLFNAILYTFGGAGGTFNVPDMRQRFPLGKAISGTGAVLGSSGGTIDHTHSVPREGWNPTSASAASFVGYLRSILAGDGVVAVPMGNNTSGTANPPFLTVNFIIKT